MLAADAGKTVGQHPAGQELAKLPRDELDLHANVRVGPNDRARLEQLCRYVLRPSLAENRLRRLADGRVRLELKRPWSDGTTHLLFEPVEFLEKLATLECSGSEVRSRSEKVAENGRYVAYAPTLQIRARRLGALLLAPPTKLGPKFLPETDHNRETLRFRRA